LGTIDIKQLRLSSLEKKAVNDMFVILSDVWLDNPEVFLFYISFFNAMAGALPFNSDRGKIVYVQISSSFCVLSLLSPILRTFLCVIS
jgi:hypothetical protein